MDETYVINQAKEDSCFVAQDFIQDMKETREKGTTNSIVRDYVLPDFTTIKRGYLRPREESTGKASDGEQVTYIIMKFKFIKFFDIEIIT